MIKLKQKQIKQMIENGEVIDVTRYNDDELREINLYCVKKYYSTGVYGANGAIVQYNGKLYGTACRCVNMFCLI